MPPPPDESYWTVHGIWPTKVGTEGPSFCNKSWHFDPDRIKPFEDNMEKFWTNIEANTKLTSLWNHEWTKHGTCAAQIPQLNSEENYFAQGITWVQKFNLAEILMSTNVVPSQQGYTVEDIHKSVVNAIKKNPMIQCVVDKKSKKALLSEIRICFDKKLEMVDCDLLKTGSKYYDGKILTNCDSKNKIMYYDKLPSPLLNNARKTHLENEAYFTEEMEYISQLKSIYDMLQFLIWLTR